MHFEHKFIIKNMLGDYLRQQGIDINKNFKCLNDCGGSKNKTMGFKNDMVRCFRCNVKYDIFELIGKEYNLNSFREQYQQACILFNLEDDFNKHKYKKTAKKAKNDIIDSKKEGDLIYKKYNDFYNKLIDKRKELLRKLENIDNKSKEYQDLKFKLDFIDEFTSMILEYNNTSIKLISGFNESFNKAYKGFKKYYLDI